MQHHAISNLNLLIKLDDIHKSHYTKLLYYVYRNYDKYSGELDGNRPYPIKWERRCDQFGSELDDIKELVTHYLL